MITTKSKFLIDSKAASFANLAGTNIMDALIC